MSDYLEDGFLEDQGDYFGQRGTLARFILGDRVLIFGEAPALSLALELSLVQGEAKSAGGDRFGLAVYDSDDLVALSWSRMFTYHKDRLVDWFLNVARGMSEAFVYRDPWGVERTVRFWAAELPEIRERAADRFEVSFVVRVEQ